MRAASGLFLLLLGAEHALADAGHGAFGEVHLHAIDIVLLAALAAGAVLGALVMRRRRK